MKCAYPPCTCTVEAVDGHCGPACRMGLGDLNEACKCGHAECSSTQGSG